MKVGEKKSYTRLYDGDSTNSTNFVKFIFSITSQGSESLSLYKNGEGYDINRPKYT